MEMRPLSNFPLLLQFLLMTDPVRSFVRLMKPLKVSLGSPISKAGYSIESQPGITSTVWAGTFYSKWSSCIPPSIWRHWAQRLQAAERLVLLPLSISVYLHQDIVRSSPSQCAINVAPLWLHKSGKRGNSFIEANLKMKTQDINF